MFGIYREDDDWSDDFGPGERCPSCGAPDWHPDPSGPYGQTWWICESCSHTLIAETGTSPAECPHPRGPGREGFCPVCGTNNDRIPKCTDGWHGNQRCPKPQHVTTQKGATFERWRCETCGATGEDTWD